MSLFGGNYENSPLVIDLSQNLKFHRNHHAGLFHDSHPVGDEVPRRIVEWYPRDAVEEEESERLCRHSVRKDRVVEFPPGVISPRGVFWLMPDKADQLPEMVKNHKQLSPFFNAWFRHKEVMRALKYKAQTESEVMDKLKFATTPTELDDRVARVMNNYIDDIQERAQEMNSSGSDGDS
jgi:hypothetical protein